jgi:hypothetical protein
MSMKKLLDGIDGLRTVVNHPNLSAEEKVAAMKTAIEVLRNDIQDVADHYYDNCVVDEKEGTVSDDQVESLYQNLKEKEFNDLVFFYKKGTFAEIKESSARAALASILLRIASEQNKQPPAIWSLLATSAGVINEDVQ